MAYRNRDLVALFDVSGETIRTWAVEFAGYLSPMAKPSPGKQRIFSDEDMAVMALVAAMKNEGKVYEDIHAALQAGQRGDLSDFIENQSTDVEVAGQLAFARQQMTQLRAERDEALSQQRELHDEVIRLKTQLEFYTDQAAKLDELNRKIGRLEALLEMAKGGDEAQQT